MERRLNFEVIISHLFLKAKQPNDQIGKILYPRFIKTVQKMNILVLSGIWMELYYDRSHSFNEKSVNKQCSLDAPAQCQCDLENEVKVTKI